jgi:hypothetical protein
MNHFSLLQLSLDQKIERRAFEDASDSVPSVARADCAMLHRHLYGIVASNLPEQDARAFQAELAQRDFPTLVVPDRELPLLEDSFQIQQIEVREQNLVLTDSMGHPRIRPVAELVFLAAGAVSRLHFKSGWNQHLDSGIESHGAARLVTEHELYEKSEIEFRLDFFFSTRPERQHASASAESIIIYQGTPLSLRDSDGLRALTTAMAELLPPERLSPLFHHPGFHPHYPTLRDYQNEIRWHFHRLGLTV